jgi:flagellar biosynthesis protein
VRKAVALRYDREVNRAPEVVASGQGLLAERILELARAHGVPCHEDRELVEALLKLPVGTEIPPELYQLVAQVLAFVLRLDEQESRGQGGKGNGQG